MAIGGMIGGGDVRYRPLLKCESAGIDPTHESAPFVWVAQEINYDGSINFESPLRVITLDQNLDYLRFYVTHDTNLWQAPDSTRSLLLWRYAEGTLGNEEIGLFHWNERTNTGFLKVEFAGETEELKLSNCQLQSAGASLR